MDRKRRRTTAADILRRVAGAGGVSAAGLSDIIAELQAAGSEVQELASSRRVISRAILDTFDEFRLVLQMPLIEGGFFDWELLEPGRLMAETVHRCPLVRQAFTAAVAASPPSVRNPWHLVVGFDEFAPGNKLKVDNRRKAMVLSFTFRELGQAAMSDGSLWFTPVVVRSVNMNLVAGGWSAMLAAFLRRFLLGTAGLCSAGVPLELTGGGVCMMFASLSNLLTDGDAWKYTFDWRGHSSFKPCFKHPNVLRKGSDLAWRKPGYCEIVCSDPLQFRSWSKGDVHAAVDTLSAAADRVTAGTLTQVRYDQLEMAYGLG